MWAALIVNVVIMNLAIRKTNSVRMVEFLFRSEVPDAGLLRECGDRCAEIVIEKTGYM